MTEQPIDYQVVNIRIQQALRAVNDPQRAMEIAVNELAERVPHYDWVGIYLLEGDMLLLGPYRGEPSPHTSIPVGKGICGAAAATRKTVVVPDVNADPRYLACSIKTKSEVVVPIMDGVVCVGEIDIDSHTPNAFADADRTLLEDVAKTLAKILNRSGGKADAQNK